VYHRYSEQRKNTFCLIYHSRDIFVKHFLVILLDELFGFGNSNLFSVPVKKMPDYFNRFQENHSGTDIFHYFPYFIPHLRLVAVHPAAAARGLILPENAFIQFCLTVLAEAPAFITQPVFPMMLAAIMLNHKSNNAFFILNPVFCFFPHGRAVPFIS